jgi:anion-transporting  ArsA/GET3 family ATPase
LATSGPAALEEYLHLIIPVKRLVRTVVESRPYQYFVAAAPGLKELLMMGKVWYEERRRNAETQHPYWDLLIVDMPATGHSLQYLRMPDAARDTFVEGLVHREAGRIVGWLRDSDKTAINLVTTLEELPVNETLETYQQLTEDLRLPLGLLCLNRVHQSPFSASTLSRVRVNTRGAMFNRHLAEQVLACAQTEVELVQSEASFVQQLQPLALPTVRVPFCFAEEFGRSQIEHLSCLFETACVEKPQKREAGRRQKSKAAESLG